MNTDRHRWLGGYGSDARYGVAVVAIGLLLGLARPAAATVEVFACEPEWGALAEELGGDDVAVFTATTAQQDPHHVQARPRLIAKVRRADLLVCTGAELEVGWLPLLLRQGHNPRIQVGQPGYFLAADHVAMREKPERLDRAEGDVHPGGNPHIQSDPRNIARVADALADRLAQLDPGRAAAYRDRHADFARRWQEALQRWEVQARLLRGTPIVVHHTSWIYLEHWLGLVRVASLEPKPGVPPSATHLAEVLSGLAVRPARLVVRTPYEDPRPSAWLAERAAIPAVVLPFTVGGTAAATNLVTLFDDTLTRLLEAIR
jgi:zinc/manganese transport system substrate-binding protein